MPRVYASLPLTGPPARIGRDLLRGMELAVEGGTSCELVVLDEADGNADRAAGDAAALAYIGEAHSNPVDASQEVLGPAGLLHIAPVATWVGLGGPTLVRLSPHDGVAAAAIAGWLVEQGVERLLVLHDWDEGYGVPVGRMCADAALERGLDVTARKVDEDLDPRGAQAVLYAGVAGSGFAGMWRSLHETDPSLWLLGTEGVADRSLVAQLDPGPAERTRIFVAQRAPFAFYGYEAMRLAVDSLGTDRAETVANARATKARDSIIGRYSLDAEGHTTNPAYGRVRVESGALVWD